MIGQARGSASFGRAFAPGFFYAAGAARGFAVRGCVASPRGRALMHPTLVLLAAAALAAESTLDGLLRDHAAARGGAARIESMRNIALDLEIVEPGFTVDGRYAATRDGCMRIDVFAGGKHAISEG